MRDNLRNYLRFEQINLMDKLSVEAKDVIFCRNTVIYFDKDTQRMLFERMQKLQRTGDYLFLGHSESLFKVSDAWNLIGKTIYQRNEK